ncbi:MAG: YdbH domain-containing protein, partial [Deltaproteobacteria bacterium]|nr:YdbH domain-containing protein [Deltaproteobacteria bacterium]
VRRIGLTGADLGTLQIGDRKTSALSVASVQIDYSPQVIFTNYIHRIVLSGIELRCEYSNGELIIPGFDIQTFFASPTQGIQFGGLEIRNAVLMCLWEGTLLRLPVELLIVSENTEMASYYCTFRIFPDNREIVFTASFDSKERKILLKGNADSFPLERLTLLNPVILGLSLAGEVSLKGNADLALEPFTFSSASASCEFNNACITYNGMKVLSAHTTKQADLPFRIAIKKAGSNNWKISLSSLPVVSPLPLQVSDTNLSLHIMQDVIKCSGNSTIRVDPSKGEPITSLEVLEPIYLKGNFTTTIEKNGAWDFNFTTAAADVPSPQLQTCKLGFSNTRITSKSPEITIAAQGQDVEGSAHFTLRTYDTNVTTQTVPLTIPSVSLNGDLRFSPTGGGKSVVAFDCSLHHTDLTVSSANILLPTISFVGKAEQCEGSETYLSGTANFTNASVRYPALHAQANGINGTIPFQWPWRNPGSQGSISVKDLQWEHLNLGSLVGTIVQQEFNLLFAGQYMSSLIPNLTFTFTGTAGYSSAQGFRTAFDFKLPPYKTPSEIDLGKFLPSLKGVIFSGELALDGDWVYGNTGMQSSLRSQLNNAKIILKEEDLTIEGLNLALHMPDVFAMRTAPRQLISFERASLGTLKIDNGEIEFQTESPTSLLIEKSGFHWCEGTVSTQAFRISPGVEDYNLILFCDRLKLAMILEQFGAAQAAGEGTVNGKIPLKFNNGQLSFGDGFLFSTPGYGGTLHLTGTEMLTAGIPANTPQFAQIELAREALKDFTYEWVKLNLITEG